MGHAPRRWSSRQQGRSSPMKRLIFSLLTLAAIINAADTSPAPSTPQVSDKTRLEFSEARSQRALAQAAYDALPAQIKKAFEEAINAVQMASKAEQDAANQAIKECGDAYRPVLDAGKLICQPNPPAEKSDKK